jgi:hypothetical protein
MLGIEADLRLAMHPPGHRHRQWNRPHGTLCSFPGCSELMVWNRVLQMPPTRPYVILLPYLALLSTSFLMLVWTSRTSARISSAVAAQVNGWGLVFRWTT